MMLNANFDRLRLKSEKKNNISFKKVLLKFVF